MIGRQVIFVDQKSKALSAGLDFQVVSYLYGHPATNINQIKWDGRVVKNAGYASLGKTKPLSGDNDNSYLCVLHSLPPDSTKSVAIKAGLTRWTLLFSLRLGTAHGSAKFLNPAFLSCFSGSSKFFKLFSNTADASNFAGSTSRNCPTPSARGQLILAPLAVWSLGVQFRPAWKFCSIRAVGSQSMMTPAAG